MTSILLLAAYILLASASTIAPSSSRSITIPLNTSLKLAIQLPMSLSTSSKSIKYHVQIDTGSSTLWLPAASCRTCSSLAKRVPLNTTELESRPKKERLRLECHIRYLDGSHINGYSKSLNVTLPLESASRVSVTKQGRSGQEVTNSKKSVAVKVPSSCIATQVGGHSLSSFDGILGLSPASDFLAALSTSVDIAPQFGVKMTQPAQFHLGKLPKEYHISEWYPCVRGFGPVLDWRIRAHTFSAGSQETAMTVVKKRFKTVIDTGAQGIVLPRDDFLSILTACGFNVNDRNQVRPQSSKNMQNASIYFVDYDMWLKCSMRVTFATNENANGSEIPGRPWNLDPRAVLMDIVEATGKNPMARLSIVVLDDANQEWIFGQGFLSPLYSAYKAHPGSQAVGFAELPL